MAKRFHLSYPCRLHVTVTANTVEVAMQMFREILEEAEPEGMGVMLHGVERPIAYPNVNPEGNDGSGIEEGYMEFLNWENVDE